MLVAEGLAEALDPSIVERELEEAKAAESETRKSSTSSKKRTRSASGSTANNRNPLTKPLESEEEEASRSKKKKRLSRRSITDLPLELLEQIASHVPFPDIFRLPDVSNEFEKATRHLLSPTSPKLVSHFRERFHLHISIQTDIKESYQFDAFRAHVFPKLRAQCKVSAEEMRLFKKDNLLEQHRSFEEMMEYFEDEEELNEYLDSLDQDDEKLMEEGIREPINYYMDWMVINGYGDNMRGMRDFVWTLYPSSEEGDWFAFRCIDDVLPFGIGFENVHVGVTGCLKERGCTGRSPGIYRWVGDIREEPSDFTILESVQLSVDTANYDENEADDSDRPTSPYLQLTTQIIPSPTVSKMSVSEISFPSVKIPVSLVRNHVLAHWQRPFHQREKARQDKMTKERRDKLWNEVAAPFVAPYNRVFDENQNKRLNFNCATEGHPQKMRWREMLDHLKEAHLIEGKEPSEYENLLRSTIVVSHSLIGELKMPVPKDLSTFIATLRQKQREEETRRETQRKTDKEIRERQRKEEEARRKTERKERERLWNQVAMPFIRPYDEAFGRAQKYLKFTCLWKDDNNCNHMTAGVTWKKVRKHLNACHLDECTKATEGNENPMPSIVGVIDTKR
ncbi:hypothetical protein HK104_007505, partial [Borealophlyctis nickersoniae]